jgi:hypothetical protein
MRKAPAEGEFRKRLSLISMYTHRSNTLSDKVSQVADSTPKTFFKIVCTGVNQFSQNPRMTD